ncbi:hypothetical protein ADM99_03715 [Leptolinea tardivitalis]|uniref:DUF3788 family protein n=2 Tax=Leptolinea tardivitalis TaxID=229920 RepID=A0A0P6X202_9CHLR|nr:hypothetical protein ADM99_03715 [Leptolinea tardivitalis]
MLFLGVFSMSIGYFTDKKTEPADTDVRRVIGSRLSLWEKVINGIQSTYSPMEDFKFLYGSNYGWGRRFRLKGQLLTSLYPTEGGFTVQIILDPESIEAALNMNTGKNTRQAIEKATPYPEGRWLFIPVENQDDVKDIFDLLILRVKSKKLVKS